MCGKPDATGFGTALKPAVEFWILARKPFDCTVAANVQTHGTGALNIDACRIGFESDEDKASAKPQGAATAKVGALAGGVQNNAARSVFQPKAVDGRFPANLLLDEGAAALLDEHAGELTSGKPGVRRKAHETMSMSGRDALTGKQETGYADSGGASRFFYVAKAPTSEKYAALVCGCTPALKVKDIVVLPTKEATAIAGQACVTCGCEKKAYGHPTVKSISLMEWLVKLVTPPGGLVIDPFAGSGTTGVAAQKLGFRFLGIEQDNAHVAIARRRMRNAK